MLEPRTELSIFIFVIRAARSSATAVVRSIAITIAVIAYGLTSVTSIPFVTHPNVPIFPIEALAAMRAAVIVSLDNHTLPICHRRARFIRTTVADTTGNDDGGKSNCK